MFNILSQIYDYLINVFKYEFYIENNSEVGYFFITFGFKVFMQRDALYLYAAYSPLYQESTSWPSRRDGGYQGI